MACKLTEITIRQNAWTQLCGPSNKRTDIRFGIGTTSGSVAIFPSATQPPFTPANTTPPSQVANTSTFGSDELGMVQEAWWVFTTAAGVEIAVIEGYSDEG